MFADSPFAVPRSSFERPVPLVLIDPDVAPLVCIKINREWVPYILGALKQLVLQTTWKTDDPDALNLVQARAMLLISMFQQALTNDCDDCCVIQDMSTGAFNWQPGNPFTAPNDVPDGYHFPPWYVAPQTTLIPTIRAGDVVTDILHAPFNPLPSGFPRFRLTVDGPGTIEIKFVRFPTASVALWTVDGNIATTRWTDLHVSLEAAIGRFDPEMVIPIEVSGTGQHVLDVSIVPSITEEPPFVHFGGAIRSISLCGFGSTEPIFTPVDELEYIMSVCEQLRFHNGKLQGLCCGFWEDIAGQSGITAGGPDQPGGNPPQPQPQPGGGCQSYHLKFTAKEQALVPTVVNTGDVITFSNAKGAGTDGTARWSCPDGSIFFGGACVGGSTYTEPTDPAPTQNHLALIARINGVWYPAYNGSVTVPAGVSSQQITIQVNDSSLVDNSGDYTLDVEVCNNAAAAWTHILDLTVSPNGFTLFHPGDCVGGTGYGSWVAGTGFIVGDCDNGAGTYVRAARFELDFAATDITSMYMTTDSTVGANGSGGTLVARLLYVNSGGGGVSYAATPTPVGTGLVTGANAPLTIYGIILSLDVDYEPSMGALGGSGRVYRLTVSGTGFDPFA